MIKRRTVLTGIGASLLVRHQISAAKPQGAAIDVPIRLTDSRIGVDVTIAGKGPFGFILDTGGVTSLIDVKVSRVLGLSVRGQAQLGMAHKKEAFNLVEADDVVVGNAFRSRSVLLAETDLIHFGDGFVGSFDAGFLTRFPSQLLLGDSIWRLGYEEMPDLSGYRKVTNAIIAKGPAGGSAYLFADIKIEGQLVRLVLDTGAPSAIRLSAAAARRTGFDKVQRRDFYQKRDGLVVARAIRAGSVEIAGLQLGSPVIFCEKSGESSAFPDGLMGLRLLRLLDMATDPTTGSVFIRRNGQAYLPDQGPYADL